METRDRELALAIAGRLRELRQDAGLSIDAVAARAGMHRTSLGLIERGERLLSIASAKRLAAAFDMPLWQLVYEAERGSP